MAPKSDDGTTYYDDEYPSVTFTKATGLKIIDGEADLFYKVVTPAELADQVIYYDGKYYWETESDDAGFVPNKDVLFLVKDAAAKAEGAYPAEYSCDAVGQGLAYVGKSTTLRTIGLNTCVGLLIYNDSAAYLTHVVIDVAPDDVVNGESKINGQVGELVTLFKQKVGEAPDKAKICVDKAQPGYAKDDAFKEGIEALLRKAFAPDGCTSEVSLVVGRLEHSLAPSATKPRVEWKGPAISK